MDATMQKRLDEIQLKTAERQLKIAEREQEEFEAAERRREKDKADRQRQLDIENGGLKLQAKRCSHRQGGTPRNPYAGKGPTALSIQKMPDGETLRINCNICRFRLFSPFAPNQSKKPKFLAKEQRKETAAEVETRAAAYWKAKEEFDGYYQKAQEGLTEDSVQPMDCGTTFSIKDEDGNPVLRPRPSDDYAIQYAAA